MTEARLPDSGGLQFVRDLRRSRGGALPPVVVLTDEDGPALRDLLLEEGVARFLRKSEAWPGILADIHGLIAEHEGQATGVTPGATASRTSRDARVFRGSLETIEMLDILQLLNLGRKTGVLVLGVGSGAGRIWFDGGEIVAVEKADSTGEAAFRDLLALKRGAFRFETGPIRAERTLHKPTSALILDALRLEDESGRSPALAPEALDDAFDFEHAGAANSAADAAATLTADTTADTGAGRVADRVADPSVERAASAASAGPIERPGRERRRVQRRSGERRRSAPLR
nr:DUF4388 domain-containing protein [Gemmatimonadota bacterium]